MKKNKTLLLLLAGAAAVMLIAYFAVVRPLVNQPRETEPPPVTEDGEGVLYRKVLLYESIKRADMASITVHNAGGEYKFERSDVADATTPFQLSIRQGDVFESYAHIKYNEEKFSELVVSTGTTYVLERVVDSAADEAVLAEYGLSVADDPSWFEIRTIAGQTLRVYVGDSAVTDNGYYLRLEGRNTVYVSSTTSIGKTAHGGVQNFVDPTLSTPFASYGFYYTKDFTLWKRQNATPDAVTGEDSVKLSYTPVIDGVAGEAVSGSVDLRKAITEFRDALIGRHIGDKDFSFTVAYAEDDEQYPGKTVEYRVNEVESINRLTIALDFMNMSKRSDFDSGVAYKITAPASKTGYLASSNHYMGVLEAIGDLKGVETIAVGLTSEVMARYGLDAYTIYYETPVNLSYDKDNPEDVVAEAYFPNFLYISQKQADGSYYVGSLLFDIVARVDGAEFAFLEHTTAWWLKESMFSVNVNKTRSIAFDFTYRDETSSHTFVLTQKETTPGKPFLSDVVYLQGNRRVDVNAYKSLHMNLVTIYFSGEYDGTAPTSQILADAGARVLTMTLTMTDGKVYVYRFYPYSARHVLVSVEREGGAEGAYFYITADEVEKLYADIQTILAGGIPNPEKRY